MFSDPFELRKPLIGQTLIANSRPCRIEMIGSKLIALRDIASGYRFDSLLSEYVERLQELLTATPQQQ